MSLSINTMFSIPILKFKIQDWNNKKKKLLEVLNSKTEEIEYGDSIHTDFFKNNNTEFTKNFFREEIHALEKFTKTAMTVGNGWFEVARKGNFHSVHNHYPLGYSAVCYINFNKLLHSRIHFIAPFTNFIDGTALNYTPDIEEGDIIYFPSPLLHYTLPNEYEEERIVFSFNMIPKSENIF